MHHLKETTIDGVKFVLIPEELREELVLFVHNKRQYVSGDKVAQLWEKYDPEIFNGL